MFKYRLISKILMIAGSMTLFAGTAVNAQDVAAEQSMKIDALFANWNRTDSPGCAD